MQWSSPVLRYFCVAGWADVAGVRSRRLVGRLRDGGEAARRAQAAVEAELARRRAAPAPVSQTATVQQLTEQLQRMEWSSGRPPPPGGETAKRKPLDMTDTGREWRVIFLNWTLRKVIAVSVVRRRFRFLK